MSEPNLQKLDHLCDDWLQGNIKYEEFREQVLEVFGISEVQPDEAADYLRQIREENERKSRARAEKPWGHPGMRGVRPSLIIVDEATFVGDSDLPGEDG